MGPKPAAKEGKGGQGGQAMVEFAVAATLFFTLIAAILDLSRGVWYQGTLQNAVREATRYAMVHGSASSSPVGPADGNYTAGPPSTDSTLTTLVKQYVPGLSTSSVTVGSSWPNGDDVAGHQVTVTASFPFTPFFRIWGLGTITLSATATQTIVH